ncbi:sensor histidine kinase [Pueribacillus sp. YX66]|uniref:sensor histidine kinase n=1 Tax=Pueribacillus sp. YX66 TaxID=3229242 RepID=UPI00358CEED0
MQKWYQLFPKSPWISIYVWIIFFILPFFFIFRSTSTLEIVSGTLMVIVFFLSYRFSFFAKGWLVYFWMSIGMMISCALTFFFGYVYFSLFLAVMIGNIRHTVGFFVLYGVHLVLTIIAVVFGVLVKPEYFLSQLSFVIICIIGIILLPFHLYNRNRREQLEGQLEKAHKRISQLVVIEERQRIARDLHDTLGQKLSLIGLKSDLAIKILDKKPDVAKREIHDIQQTARVALKEVRELVSNMRGVKLKDEIERVESILKAANIQFTLEGNPTLRNIPLGVESVLSMCLKEAVTNVVKHSQATKCNVSIEQTRDEVKIHVYDNGIGHLHPIDLKKGHGLAGMKERLEFINGSLHIDPTLGMSLVMKVPNVIKPIQEG